MLRFTLVALLALLPFSPARAQAPPAPALTYQAALELATRNNLGLAAARRQLAIRQAEVLIARQIPNPELSFEGTRDVPHETLGFNLPIEVGGKRARRIELARQQETLADLDVRTEMRTLRRNLRQAFYGLAGADERLRLAEEVAGIARRVRDVAQARFEEGAAPRLDVLQAELGIARADADVQLAGSARLSAQADLNAVLNQPPGQIVAIAGDPVQVPAVPDFARAMELASTSNIDLLTAERNAAVEQRRIALLKAERVPTPVFSVGGVFDAPGEFQAGLFGGVTWELPLFTRNQGEIAQSAATVGQLQAQRDAARRVVESEVFGALARIDAGRKQVEAYRATIVPTAVSLEGLAEESYKLGRSSVLGVLDAQRSLRDVRREYLQAALDLQSAIADLEEVIGAGLQ